MSWDSYITTLQNTGHIQDAAIGTSDGSVWAKSANFNISVEELKGLSAKRECLYQNGVMLGGRKFHVLRYDMEDPKDPYMNLKSNKDEKGNAVNATVYKTNKAYVIGVGGPTAQGGSVVMEVCKIGSYLVSAQF